MCVSENRNQKEGKGDHRGNVYTGITVVIKDQENNSTPQIKHRANTRETSEEGEKTSVNSSVVVLEVELSRGQVTPRVTLFHNETSQSLHNHRSIVIKVTSTGIM